MDAVFVEGEVPIKMGEGTDFWQSYSDYMHDLIQELAKSETPMLVGDLQPEDNILKDAVGALGGSAAMGATAVSSALFSRKMTRREFLKGVLAGTVAVWGYEDILGRLATSTLGSLDRKQPWVKKLKEFSGEAELLHPEDLIRNFRNVMIAEKLLWYAEQKQKETGVKPTIGIVMGSVHENITEYLKRGREFCQKYLDLYPKSILESYFGKENMDEQYSRLTELKPTKDGSFFPVFLVDPELQKKVAKNETEVSYSTQGENKG